MTDASVRQIDVGIFTGRQQAGGSPNFWVWRPNSTSTPYNEYWLLYAPTFVRPSSSNTSVALLFEYASPQPDSSNWTPQDFKNWVVATGPGRIDPNDLLLYEHEVTEL